MNVKTLCLGSLCLMDGTGYDIKKLFEQAFSHFHSASYGSIYPSLNQLRQDGLIDLRVERSERLAELPDQVCRHYRETLAYLESLQECSDNTAGIRFTIGLGIAIQQAKLAFIESQRDHLLAEHRVVPRSWPEEK